MAMIWSEMVSNQQSLERTVTQLVTYTLNGKLKNVQPGDPLFSAQAGFDSFALTELILRLEDTFGIHIPDEDLDLDIFYSVETIASYLQLRLEQSH